jgi:hypothetical protein
MPIVGVPLFVIGCISGFAACAIYFWILSNVSSAGTPVKFFATGRYIFVLFNQYRDLSRTRGWPLWPIAAFWTLALLSFALALLAFYLPSK